VALERWELEPDELSQPGLDEFCRVQEEGRLLSVLQEFNQVLARLGFKGVRYRLWKIQGAAAGLSGYMYESTWPSLEIYDRVHKEAAYTKVLEKHLPFLREVLKNEIYDKLVELQPK
jgi:hypothetical protein